MSDLSMEIQLVPIAVQHAPRLALLMRRNHDDLKEILPGAPERPSSDDEVALAYEELATARRLDQRHAFGIRVADEIFGLVSLSGIVRGPLQSATIGLWLDRSMRARGIGTRVIALASRIGFDELSLHRLEAGIQPTNTASLRAFRANAFEPIGLARGYLLIDGQWRDHVLLQKLGP